MRDRQTENDKERREALVLRGGTEVPACAACGMQLRSTSRTRGRFRAPGVEGRAWRVSAVKTRVLCTLLGRLQRSTRASKAAHERRAGASR